MKISVSTEVNADKEAVWAAITDIQHCSSVISGILDLTILNEPKDGLIGLKWSETREMFGKEAIETMWVTECKETEYYCTRSENGSTVYLTTMAIATIDENYPDTTLLTMSFSGTSDSLFVRFLAKMMGIFIKKTMIKMINQDLEDIKTFVETKKAIADKEKGSR